MFTVGKTLQFSADHHSEWPLFKLWEHRFSFPYLVSPLLPPPPRSPPGTHECILYELSRYLEKEGVLKFLSNASLLNFRGTWGLTFPIKCMTEHVTVAMVDITYTKSRLFYGAFSITWLASMQIYWNKRKRLHKKRVQLPKDCFGTPIWPPWRHVKTLYWSSGSIPQGTCFCKLYNFEVTGGG